MKTFNELKDYLESEEVIAESLLASTPASLITRLESSGVVNQIRSWIAIDPTNNLETLSDYAKDLIIELGRAGRSSQKEFSLIACLVYFLEVPIGEPILNYAEKLVLKKSDTWWISKIASILLYRGASNAPRSIKFGELKLNFSIFKRQEETNDTNYRKFWLCLN